MQVVKREREREREKRERKEREEECVIGFEGTLAEIFLSSVPNLDTPPLGTIRPACSNSAGTALRPMDERAA